MKKKYYQWCVLHHHRASTYLPLDYTIKGLGLKGLNKTKQANETLQKAVELPYSNLWAKLELENY